MLLNDPLLRPTRLGLVELRNRICMPAMHTHFAQEFRVTQRMLDFYRERSSGGVALITVGFATIDERSAGPKTLGAHRKEFVPGLRRLAGAIHDGGAAAAVQLNHGGRYTSSRELGGRQPIAPSAIASRLTGETPEALSEARIRSVVRRFGTAATRVMEAGFDAVELQFGTGYLVSEFLSPVTNLRDDRYGGPMERRLTFALDVLQYVREQVGKETPIIVRLNGNDLMPGGLGREDMGKIAVQLTADDGADALSVNAGWHESGVPQITAGVPAAAFAYLAGGIREHVQVPVIASHRINSVSVARELVGAGVCDMVAMGRALIADPQLPAKVAAGDEHRVLHCVACAQGCFDQIWQGRPVQCLVNPRAGHEGERTVRVAGRSRRVLVVGGGPAGMSAASTAAGRGHEVTLVEQSGRLGGQLLLASAPPGRQEFARLVEDLTVELHARGVRVRLGERADPQSVARSRPDAVIVATGARPLVPSIPGVDMAHVMQAWDVLAGRIYAGERVVVVGGGAVGVETALFLARQGSLSGDNVKFLLVNHGEDPAVLEALALRGPRQVTLVEILPKLGQGLGLATRWTLLQELRRAGVATFLNSTIERVEPSMVIVQTPQGPRELVADSVVLACGCESYNPLETVGTSDLPSFVVGDASEVATAFEAIHTGFMVGSQI